MNVSAASASEPTTVTGTEIAVTVMKKALDARKVEGQLLVELIDQSKVSGVAGRLDVYA